MNPTALDIDAVVCWNVSDGCYSQDVIEYYYNGDYMRVWIVEGYVDPSRKDDPIRYKFNKYFRLPITVGGLSMQTIGIKENTINTLDGRSIIFYQNEDLLNGYLGFASSMFTILF